MDNQAGKGSRYRTNTSPAFRAGYDAAFKNDPVALIIAEAGLTYKRCNRDDIFRHFCERVRRYYLDEKMSLERVEDYQEQCDKLRSIIYGA